MLLVPWWYYSMVELCGIICQIHNKILSRLLPLTISLNDSINLKVDNSETESVSVLA